MGAGDTASEFQVTQKGDGLQRFAETLEAQTFRTYFRYKRIERTISSAKIPLIPL